MVIRLLPGHYLRESEYESGLGGGGASIHSHIQSLTAKPQNIAADDPDSLQEPFMSLPYTYLL